MLNVLDYKNPIFIPGKLNIWLHQLNANPTLVESMLKHKEGKSEKYNARSLSLVEIDARSARDFMNQNHLSGHTNSTFRYGLTDGSDILCLMTLGHSRFAKNFSLEILRFASKQGVVVRGGAAKILSYVKKEHTGSILSYSDLMLGNGGVYKEIGFEFLGQTPKGYFWEKNGEIVPRYRTQKHKIFRVLGEDVDLSKSETFLMTQAGYNRVFDLGHLRWGLMSGDQNELTTDLKFHYVYRITRPEIDDCFYIGVHSTNDLNDNYLGSGDLIVASVKKYGKAKHQKEILKEFETRELALEYEREIVSKDLIEDEKCMNISLGGGNIFMPHGTTKGKLWVWDPRSGKEVFIEESWGLQFYEKGWLKGRNPKNKTNLCGSWFINEDGTSGRTKQKIPEGAVAGRKGVTGDYRWVTRNGVQTLVKDIQEGDELGFKQCKTNKGLRKIVKDGITKLVTAEEEAKLLEEGASKPIPPTLGKIGMKSPNGIKKLVSLAEARFLVKEGWTLAAKTLKGVSPTVRDFAIEIGIKVPKNKHSS